MYDVLSYNNMKYYDYIYCQFSITGNINLWSCANQLMYTSIVIKGMDEQWNELTLMVISESNNKW